MDLLIETEFLEATIQTALKLLHFASKNSPRAFSQAFFVHNRRSIRLNTHMVNRAMFGIGSWDPRHER